MKTCTKCKGSKSLSSFAKSGRGLQPWCRSCVATYDRSRRERIAAERGDERECSHCGEVKHLSEFGNLGRGKRHNCNECHAAYQRQWHADHPDYHFLQKLKHQYRITPERYVEMVRQQGGVCAACRTLPEGASLQIDHDHACCPGKKSCGRCVRALLCPSCNLALGSVRDSAERLQSLIKYLNDKKPRHVVAA